LPTMLEIVNEYKGVKDVTEKMVIEAYETPRFIAKDVQMEAIENFADEWYLKCVKEQKK